jgi:hypothetical protein
LRDWKNLAGKSPVGHLVNSDREYRLLQQQMDHAVTAVPDSPVLMKILKILFSPEEAALARHLSTILSHGPAERRVYLGKWTETVRFLGRVVIHPVWNL